MSYYLVVGTFLGDYYSEDMKNIEKLMKFNINSFKT